MATPYGVESFANLNSHDDNMVLGSASPIIHDTGHRVDILGFAHALGLIELPIVLGAVT